MSDSVVVRFFGEVLAGGGGGHAVLVPAALTRRFSRRNPKVRAVVNGTAYRSRIARYGGKSYLGLRRELLQTIGADTGDTVEIELSEEVEPDPPPAEEPVTADEPGELTAALAPTDLRAAFDRLPAEHRAEYRRWVAAGADTAARTERAARTVRRLSRPN